MSKKRRVKAIMHKSYNSASDEYTETLIQYLQEHKTVSLFGFKLFGYWKTIDQETVPSFAWLQRAIFGSTEWKSKWNGMKDVTWIKTKKQ
jgi:hypothetical protein